MTKKLPRVTIHGRFQPPLHVNHWNYAKTGFETADHVTILITNPYPAKDAESFDETAAWRNDPGQNPFSFEQRKYMWERFLSSIGISEDRFEIVPFNIKDPEAFAALDPDTPNVVNVYSDWSAKKLDSFKDHGLPVIRLDQPKAVPVSGTRIRQIINDSDEGLEQALMDAGFMPEAVPGLKEVLR
jgi:nicotinamide mononucleotide adenylyltransferase